MSEAARDCSEERGSQTLAKSEKRFKKRIERDLKKNGNHVPPGAWSLSP